MLSTEQLKAVKLEDRIFVYKTFNDSGAGFVEILVEGHMALYLKRIAHAKRVNPHPVLGSTNDDFKVVIKEHYYYGVKNCTR